MRLYVDLGAISEEDFLTQKRRLDDERAKLTTQLAELQSQTEAAEHAAALGDRLSEIAAIGMERLHAEQRQANLWLRSHFVITIGDYDVVQIEYI